MFVTTGRKSCHQSMSSYAPNSPVLHPKVIDKSFKIIMERSCLKFCWNTNLQWAKIFLSFDEFDAMSSYIPPTSLKVHPELVAISFNIELWTSFLKILSNYWKRIGHRWAKILSSVGAFRAVRSYSPTPLKIHMKRIAMSFKIKLRTPLFKMLLNYRRRAGHHWAKSHSLSEIQFTGRCRFSSLEVPGVDRNVFLKQSENLKFCRSAAEKSVTTGRKSSRLSCSEELTPTSSPETDCFKC